MLINRVGGCLIVLSVILTTQHSSAQEVAPAAPGRPARTPNWGLSGFGFGGFGYGGPLYPGYGMHNAYSDGSGPSNFYSPLMNSAHAAPTVPRRLRGAGNPYELAPGVSYPSIFHRKKTQNRGTTESRRMFGIFRNH
jgi:hypothetical protein